jgi:PAS domain S-box-containing protein
MSSTFESGFEEDVPPVSRLCWYLSECSPQPMVAVDGETHVITYVNPAFSQLVGKKRKDLINRPFTEAVPEGVENSCSELLDRVYRTGVPEKLPEQEHRQSQPQPVFWSYAMWAIMGASERPVGVMIQITDATEIANFRQQAVEINESLVISGLRQHELTAVAESLSAKLQVAVEMRDRFIAVMSHELRNPLTTLSSGLELLKLAGRDAVTVESTRDMMERQLKQLVRLVDDLLDVSRITTGKMELHKQRVELSSIVRNAVEASRAQIDDQGHKLTAILPPDPIFLNADPTRLAQVFSNLLSNSAKYSDRAGEIRLSAELDRGEIVVSVRDTGIGIPAAKLPHIFEAFVQVDVAWERRQGGMGIGLSLVKEFVELHGGHVEACSDGLGQGSEFIIRLPVAANEANEKITSPETTRSPRRRILVVDDNKTTAAMLGMLLKFLGHEVRTAHDGEAGLAAAAEYQPDLVVMDLGMPVMDGYEACRRIRAESWGGDLFLVALTGWGSVDDQRKTRDAGFDRHLVKPVDADALSKIIAEIPT